MLRVKTSQFYFFFYICAAFASYFETQTTKHADHSYFFMNFPMQRGFQLGAFLNNPEKVSRNCIRSAQFLSTPLIQNFYNACNEHTKEGTATLPRYWTAHFKFKGRITNPSLVNSVRDRHCTGSTNSSADFPSADYLRGTKLYS